MSKLAIFSKVICAIGAVLFVLNLLILQVYAITGISPYAVGGCTFLMLGGATLVAIHLLVESER